MKPLNLTLFIEKLNTIDFDKNSGEITIKDSLLEILNNSYYSLDLNKDFTEKVEEILLNNNLKIHRNYSDTVENYNRGLQISLNKNQEQIDIYLKEAENKIAVIQKEFMEHKKVFNKEITEKQTEINDLIDEAKKVYEDEVNVIKEEINILNVTSNVASQRIENEKILKLNLLTADFEKETSALNTKVAELSAVYSEKINELKNHLKDELVLKDDSYLNIKKTHTQSSVKFNEFINQIKLNNEKELQKNIQRHKSLTLVIDQHILESKKKHEELNTTIQDKYLEKTKALNIVFDVQKDAYNKKTSEIIAANNSEITNINQNIRVNREMIEEKIKLLEKEKWQNHSKATSASDKSMINKKYNTLVNKLKIELIKLGNKNKLALSKQEIIFQTNLFNHDFEHVKQINEWRYSKNIYDAERKHEFDLELNRFNHEIYSLDIKKLMYDKILDSKQEIQKTLMNKDLLPIDSQLVFASLLQNREINLLNLEFESNKLNNELYQKLLSEQLALDELVYTYNFNLLENDFSNNKKVLNITYQLEIEKEILKRNNELEILELNLKLQEDLLNYNINRHNESLNYTIERIELETKNINNEFSYLSSVIKRTATLEQRKRTAIMQEIKIKNQLQINESKDLRTIQTSKNQAESREKINQHYFEQLLNVYYNEEKIYKLLLHFISIPAHPEKIRQFITIVIELLDYFNMFSEQLIREYIDKDVENSNINLKQLSEEKFRFKHEEIIDNYNDNISILISSKEETQLKYNSLTEENVTLNNKIKQNLLLKNLYSKKTNKNIEVSNFEQLKILNKENSTSKLEIKQNIKLMAALTNDLKKINETIKKHANTKLINEANLNAEIKKEQFVYNKLLNKHQRNGLRLLKDLRYHNNTVKRMYSLLLDKPYLNDNVIELAKKKFTNLYSNLYTNLLLSNQKLLEFWLNTYINFRNEQNVIGESFDTTSNLAVKDIQDNFKQYTIFNTKELSNLRHNYELTHKTLQNKLNQLKIDNNNKLKSLQTKYRTTYQNIEKNIHSLNQNIKSKMALVTENLNDVIINLNKNHDSLSLKLKKQNERRRLKLTNKINDLDLELNNNIVRTNTRTNLILTKYENERKNYLKNMNLRRLKFNNTIDRNNTLINNLEHSYNLDVELNNKSTKRLNKDLATNLRKITIRNKYDKIRLTKKECRTLKKSYQFKARQIRLESKKK